MLFTLCEGIASRGLGVALARDKGGDEQGEGGD
jgi:hypothetical protein